MRIDTVPRNKFNLYFTVIKQVIRISIIVYYLIDLIYFGTPMLSRYLYSQSLPENNFDL